MNYLQPELVERVIKSTRGTVFNVTTEDGSINCRWVPTPEEQLLRAVGFAVIEPSPLIRVFDMKKKEHRTIDKNKIIALKANRKTYKVLIPV